MEVARGLHRRTMADGLVETMLRRARVDCWDRVSYAAFFIGKNDGRRLCGGHVADRMPRGGGKETVMLKNTILLSVLAVLGYLGWQYFFSPEEELTFEQRLGRIAGGGTVDAKELSALSAEDAASVRVLKGRRLVVNGRLARVVVKGVRAMDLIFELEGANGGKVDIVSDFSKLARMTAGMPLPAFKFQKIGKEIYLLPVAKRNAPKTDAKKENQGLVPSSTVVFREGERLSLAGVFHYSDERVVRLEMYEMPTRLASVLAPPPLGERR